MKKLVLLIAVLSLLGAACASNTTVASNASDDLAGGAEPTAQATDGDANAENDEAENDAADPTAAPEATAESEDPEPAPEADPTAEPEVEPTAEPEAEPTAEPTAEPDPEPTATDEGESTDDGAPVDFSQASLEAVQLIDGADDWCTAAQVVEDSAGDLDDLNFTDPVELEIGFKSTIAIISATQRLAPPEIADDVDQTLEAFAELTAALEAADWSFLDLDLSLIDEFDGPMELATYNIDVYNSTVCGIDVDPGEPPTNDGSTTEPTDDDPGTGGSPIEGSIREQAIAGLVEAGFTADEASCIISELDLSDPESLSDPSAMFEVFDLCNIGLDRLAELGG